jgi:gliding motility-associated-like protein
LPSADVQINQTSSSYTIIRTWNVSDFCGNSHIFTQTINVIIQDSFTVLQEQACNGDASEINLNNIIPINSMGLGTWTDSNTGMAITNGIFTPLGVLLGEHSFEYKISDLFCPRKIKILMNVNDDCLVLACGNIIVHNAFSPNNDGLNEIFTIENLENKTCYPTNKLEIYNRWGVLIYETEGYNNNDIAFKGISEGRTTIKKSDELPSGTYYYILNFTDDQGKKHNKDGYLYLSR